MTVHLTTVAGFDLISAGRALAIYQIAGAVTRPIWGWIADRWLTPGQTLAVQGSAWRRQHWRPARFGPGWPSWLVLAVAAIAGCTAGGYTGVAYAEYAHLGGDHGAPRPPASAPPSCSPACC